MNDVRICVLMDITPQILPVLEEVCIRPAVRNWDRSEIVRIRQCRICKASYRHTSKCPYGALLRRFGVPDWSLLGGEKEASHDAV